MISATGLLIKSLSSLSEQFAFKTHTERGERRRERERLTLSFQTKIKIFV